MVGLPDRNSRVLVLLQENIIIDTVQQADAVLTTIQVVNFYSYGKGADMRRLKQVQTACEAESTFRVKMSLVSERNLRTIVMISHGA